MIDACRGWHADLIVLTGDVVEDDEAIAWVEPLLAPLRGPAGEARLILGNHDEDHQPQAITLEELARAGFETLEGRWMTLDADGATIAVGGTSAPWGPALDPAAMPAADFRILLSHSPDRFYRAAEWGIDLMLAGHNHGGQIRLPLIGAVFMPSVYSRRFDRGFFRRGPTLMYASEGVAGMHPDSLRLPAGGHAVRKLRPAPVLDRTSGVGGRDGPPRPAGGPARGRDRVQG